MVPYLATFTISIFILFIVQGWSRKSIGFFFWVTIAILAPCILAGLRADSIGTDVTGYAEPLFDLARSSSSFGDFCGSGWYRIWRYELVANFEIGYVLLVWVSSRLFESLQGLLFITQALTVLPIVWTLSRKGGRTGLAFGMLVYLLMYFNTSLNLMRQWIGLSFVFFAAVGLYRPEAGFRGNAKSILSVLIGSSFHTSAFIGFAILAIRLYIDSDNHRPLRKVAVICIVVSAAIVSLSGVVSVLVSLGLYQYIGYLGNQTIELMPNQIILRLPMLGFAIWAFKRAGYTGSTPAFVLCTSIVSILLSQLTSLGEQSGRIGLYFDMFNIMLPTLLLESFDSRDVGKLPVEIVLVLYCILYWIFYYVLSGSGETVPYLPFWH